jgi:hypothetical protein
MIAAFIWMINPFAFFMSVNGMETSLYLMFFTITIWYYLGIKDRNAYSLKDGLLLGLLLGMTYLSRADGVFLGIIIFVDQLVMWIKDKTYRSVKRIWRYDRNYFFVMIAVGFLILATPWFIFNIVNFGSIQPDSNIAIQVLSYAQYFHDGFSYTKLAGAMAKEIISVPIVLWMMLGFGKLYIKGVDGYLNIVHVVLSTLACGALAAYLIIRRRKFFETIKKYSTMWPLLLMFILSMYYPIVLLRGSNTRYLAPIFILCIMLLSIILAFVMEQSMPKDRNTKKRPIVKKCLIVMVYVLFAILAFMFIRTNLRQDWQGEMLSGARWLEANTPKDAIIGSPDSGIFGYYSHRTVINLDGVMNRNAALARKDKKLMEYIDSQDIDYLIDAEMYLQQFNNETDGRLFQEYKEIYRIRHAPLIHDAPGVSSDIVVMKKI